MADESLPPGWKWTTFGTVADFVNGDRGGNYPTQSDRVGAGVPFINTGHIEPNGRLTSAAMNYITRDSFARLRSGKVEAGDIVYCLRGSTIGKTARNHFTEGAIASSLVIVRAKAHACQEYLYFYLTSPLGKQLVAQHDNGSAQPNLSVRSLSNYPLPLPPMDEQRAIAHFLGTLDDKIELNRRMNETLEAMARALFKSWFVDFDPVRAKAEGRDPGLPRPIADLFQDSFEDSELGEIPKGWEAVPLPDAIDVNPTRSLRKGVEAPYLDMANMPTRGHSPDEVVDRAFGSGMRFTNGDTLVARITPCLENGKTAFVDFLKIGQIGWGSTEYIVLRPKPPLPDEFAYCLARSAEFRDFAIQSMTGSSGRQRVPAKSLCHFRVVAAPKAIVELFGRFVRPLFAQASAATKESRTLATLRNSLLPQFISGNLRLKSTTWTISGRGDESAC
jgi:type I restriction enzyme S subunit